MKRTSGKDVSGGGMLETSRRRGERTREGKDRGIKGIFGESVVCLARFRLRAADIEDPLVIFDKILKLPTMNLLRSLA